MIANDLDLPPPPPDQDAILAAARDGIRTVAQLSGLPELDTETADFYVRSAIIGMEAHGYRIIRALW